MEAMKGSKSSVAGVLTGNEDDEGAAFEARAEAAEEAHEAKSRRQPIHSIVFACDAGMGSSAMGASVLRKKIQAAGHDEVTVVNKAISNLDDSYDLVVSHQDLTDRAKQRTPSAMHVSVDNFMGSPRYDEIVELIDRTNSPGSAVAAEQVAEAPDDVLDDRAIVLRGSATSRDDAITEAGRLLVESGAVEASYVDAMHARETSVSTHMGNLLAIPHGTNEAKSSILRTAISFVRYPEPLDWNGKPVEFVIGIAGAGDDHLALLQKIAGVFTDDAQVERLRTAGSAAEVRGILEGVRV
jgi:PTS system mannitol-specific IIC component